MKAACNPRTTFATVATALFLIIALLVSVSPTTLGAQPSLSDSSFGEEFAAAVLDPVWQEVAFSGQRAHGYTLPANHYSLTDNSGYLRYYVDPMTHSNGFMNGFQTTPPNQWRYQYDPGLELRRSFTGENWLFETKASYYMPFSNGRNFEVRIYFGTGDVNTFYVSFLRWRDGPWNEQLERNPIELRLAKKVGSAGADEDMLMLRRESPSYTPADPSYSTFYYRLERQGGILTAMWSLDGSNWTTGFSEDLGTQLNGLEQRVVLTGGSWFSPAGSYADYDYIRLAPLTVSDSTPPTLVGLPSDMVVEGNAPNGAIVTYSAPTASDDVDSTPQVDCAPASGEFFPLGGPTSVTCTATDASGNTSSGSFNITVNDTTPPSVAIPQSIVVNATSAAGASVAYATSATDIVDPEPAVTCTPVSNSVFSPGTTTVSCTATDTSGNSSPAKTFQVTVVFSLKGFYQPVDMNNVVNKAKGGSVVPMKFEVFGANGLEMTDTVVVKAITYQSSNMCSATTPTDEIEFYVASSTVPLRYDTAAGQFIYTWRTPSTPGCYKLTVTTTDSQALSAIFSIK